MRLHLCWNSAARPFIYPAGGNPRIALLAPGFRTTRSIRLFSGPTDPALSVFDPDALAGTPSQLRRIALASSPLHLRNAVIALTYEDGEALRDEDRDLFWSVFGVPVFEQYLTRANELIASECEAHDGLHAVGPAARRAAWTIETRPCACGDTHARLVRQETKDRSLAAAAR